MNSLHIPILTNGPLVMVADRQRPQQEHWALLQQQMTASAIGNTLCPTCAAKSVRLGGNPKTDFTVLIQHPQISAMQKKVMTVTGSGTIFPLRTHSSPYEICQFDVTIKSCDWYMSKCWCSLLSSLYFSREGCL